MRLLEQIPLLDFPAPLPETLLEVQQRFDVPQVKDIRADVRTAIEKLLPAIKPGDTVAVGVGSRGIAHIGPMTTYAVERLKEHGARPFIVPAMGSHGGATSAGQIEMMAALGVTEASAGCEVRATMETQPIGQIPDGPTLYQGVDSMAADHAILMSRIKPHTDFRGKLESGPSKMCVIGWGKIQGASIMHSYAGPGFRRYLADIARVYEQNTNFRGCVAIIENAYDEPAEIIGMTAAEVGRSAEEEAQTRAKSYMASIPFEHVDVLVVKELGKNISGAGMDPNILGRLMVVRERETYGPPDVATLTVLDLTEESHGNAAGLGLANVTTLRLLNKIDFHATVTNGVTSGTFGPFRGAIPWPMANDLRAIQVAVRTCGQPWATARMVFIENTLKLSNIWISASLRAEAEAHSRLKITGEVALRFSESGVIQSPWALQ